jgi:hypothetical protein
MISIRHHIKLALMAAAIGLAGCSMLQPSNTVTLSAQLSAGNQVPPNASSATGMAEATLTKDSSKLSWKISYAGLTGPATAAHIHGPAAAGANAGVVVPFAVSANPIEGQATLTAAQVADLMAGKWYVNIHTAANKGGEIRGQLMPK